MGLKSLEKFRISIWVMRFVKKKSPASVENGGKTPTHGSQPVTGRVKFEDSRGVFLDSSAAEVSGNSSAAEDTSLRNLPSKNDGWKTIF